MVWAERKDGFSQSYSVAEQSIIKYKDGPREPTKGLAQGVFLDLFSVLLFFFFFNFSGGRNYC